MNSINYYRLLKIDRSATEDDIKKAYRKLALVFHPDINTDKTAEEKFKAIAEAYSVLSNPQKRQVYDHTGTTNFNGFNTMAAHPFSRGRGMGRCMGKCSGLEAVFRRRPRYAGKRPIPTGVIPE